MSTIHQKAAGDTQGLFKQILDARVRIRPYLKPTPLCYSHSLSQRTGLDVFLKLETQNLTGSFKVRPALNGMLTHEARCREQGVLTSSSGNFAQGVAAMGSRLGISTLIVMTSSTSPLKIQKTRDWGAEVEICGPTFQDRWETTFRLERETGRVLLHPYDSLETLAGDGTLGLEINEQLREFGVPSTEPLTVFVPTSGGGLCAGVGTALMTERPGTRVYATQPRNNGSMAVSLEKGQPTEVPAFKTIADALVAQKPGQLPFSIFQTLGIETLLFSEEEILKACHFLFDEQRLVSEPGGATSIAPLLSPPKPLGPHDRKHTVVCVVSGANTTLFSKN
jgi:threonine dehydratase